GRCALAASRDPALPEESADRWSAIVPLAPAGEGRSSLLHPQPVHAARLWPPTAIGAPYMRLGLAANRLHHANEEAALFRLLRASGQGIRELGLELHAVGRTHDAIAAAGMLAGHP